MNQPDVGQTAEVLETSLDEARALHALRDAALLLQWQAQQEEPVRLSDGGGTAAVLWSCSGRAPLPVFATVMELAFRTLSLGDADVSLRVHQGHAA